MCAVCKRVAADWAGIRVRLAGPKPGPPYVLRADSYASSFVGFFR